MAGRYSHFTREDINKIKELRNAWGLGLKEAAELYMSMSSSPPVTAAAWSNADGRFGVAVIREGDEDQSMAILMEIEMSREKLITLMLDLAALIASKRDHADVI